MYSHLAALSGAVVRRAADMRLRDAVVDGAGAGAGDDAAAQLPGWAVIVFFADFLVFAPVFLYIGYTLSHVYPTLAMVEDPQPPSYTAVSLADDLVASADRTAPPPVPPKNDDDDDAATLTTSSLRRINRLLYATAGWTANFRGLGCAFALDLASVFCGAVFSTVLPRAFGVLFATLATVQLHTVWTHVVITTPSPLPFWKRLPPFGKTFQATWVPVSAYWAADQFTRFVPLALSSAFSLSRWDPYRPTAVPTYGPHAVWQSLLVVLATLLCAVCLVIPAQVILVRVQASLLPADADTIVPFDRSFGGAVEPEVVTGKGYVDFVTAWRTFGRASWLRLLKLMGKIIAVALSAYLLFLAIVVPEFLLMLHTSEPGASS